MIFSDLLDYFVLGYHVVIHQVALHVPFAAGISHISLPQQAVFPGPWEKYIKAPVNRTHIRPERIRYVEGDVPLSDALLDWQDAESSTTLKPGGLVILEFSENIAGR